MLLADLQQVGDQNVSQPSEDTHHSYQIEVNERIT